ncbi:MAG: FUSC family protein [Bacteroidota bacterium]|nr:FUSC family protein [Bacteroidota bacterium]
MKKKAQELTHFFYSQAFADGFRATFAILFPALVGYYYNQFEFGLTVALGAFCTSISDEPGPLVRKRRGMLFCIFFLFLIATLTAVARMHFVFMGLTIAVISFVFSMFMVYGSRAAAVGTATLIVMILMMDEIIPPNEIIPNSLSIAAGGTWYLLVSLFLYDLQPYRPAQRLLGKCIREIAGYLSIRADFYNESTDLDNDYRKMVAQHIVVNEHLELVRETLFKTRQIVKETTVPGKKMVFTFINAVDVFEETTASYYDYGLLRKRFGDTGILQRISFVIKQIAGELDAIGMDIESNSSRKHVPDLMPTLQQLKDEIDALKTRKEESNLVLKKILINLIGLVKRVQILNEYFKKEINTEYQSVDHSRFITSHELDPKILWTNITIRSSVFRHAIRVSAALTIGFILASFLEYGQYSYWILLTIAIILKPAFSLTKKLNTDRILGTITGGLIGIVLLVLIKDQSMQFGIIVIFMLISNSVGRINYTLMTLATTIYVVMFFNIIGIQFLNVVPERIIDTIVGGGIAFLVSYFLFPTWERHQVKKHMINMLRSNSEYLEKLVLVLAGKQVKTLDYKLARKEVYIHSANLSAAFQRMISEPKSKQANKKQLHQFVVLNHILFSNIATVASNLLEREKQEYVPELYQLTKRAHTKLEESRLKMEKEKLPMAIKENLVEITPHHPIKDYELLKDQLSFILNVCTDLSKNVEPFTELETIE